MAVNNFLISLKFTTFVYPKKNNMTPEITNYIGYAASIFVVISFALKDIKKMVSQNF